MADEKSVMEVDLRSDTVTKPTPEMRKAMAEAVVGDDVYREDPTVIKLENLVANMLGKEAALFVPTGTMGNLCSIMAHCWERGREALVGDLTHIYLFEQAGASQLAGVRLRALQTKPDGTFDLDKVRELIDTNPNIHCCYTGVLCLENTNNRCGGVALPMEYVREICRLAKSFGVPVHMDGARINNAAAYFGVPVSELVRECDSVSMCLSKGLGAPVGSVVAGTKEFIERVLRCRKVLGGAMRQVGVLAAAGIVAMEGLEKRLLRDHSNSMKLAKAVFEMGSSLVTVDMASVHTNMVVLNFISNQLTSEQFVDRMSKVNDEEVRKLGQKISVRISIWCSKEARCVLHSDVSEEAVDAAIIKMKYVINEFKRIYADNSKISNGLRSENFNGMAEKVQSSTSENEKLVKSNIAQMSKVN